MLFFLFVESGGKREKKLVLVQGHCVRATLERNCSSKNSWGYLLKTTTRVSVHTYHFIEADCLMLDTCKCALFLFSIGGGSNSPWRKAFRLGAKNMCGCFLVSFIRPFSPRSGLVHDYLPIPKGERLMLTALSGSLDSIPVVFARQWIPRLRPHFRLLSTS